jgi:hypothetical protein
MAIKAKGFNRKQAGQEHKEENTQDPGTYLLFSK